LAVEKKINSITFPAAGDLSSYQFHIVGVESDGQINVMGSATGYGTPILGVLLNKPAAADRAAEVAIVGSHTKVHANSAIDEGQLITVGVVGAVGWGSTFTGAGTQWVLGICTEAASGSGGYAGVVVNPYWHCQA